MKSKFIAFIIIIVLFVVGLGVFMNKSSSAPSKFDDFAKSLKTNGAVFYGAFWCPHCQATKALFGSSKQYLPYVECSTPSRTQTQICNENKIESYPSWSFKDGINLTSDKKPDICEINAVDGENAACQYIRSKYDRVWLFPDYKFSIKSPDEPKHDGNVWHFPSTAFATGEIPLEFLAKQINYTLPQ
jgi:thiol-disulfide isomerase/thioredoxin